MQSSNPQPAPEVEQEAPPHTRELSVEEESMGDIDYHIPICPLPEPPAGNSGSAEETK